MTKPEPTQTDDWSADGMILLAEVALEHVRDLLAANSRLLLERYNQNPEGNDRMMLQTVEYLNAKANDEANGYLRQLQLWRDKQANL